MDYSKAAMDELLVSVQSATLKTAPTNPSTTHLQADVLQNVIWVQQCATPGRSCTSRRHDSRRHTWPALLPWPFGSLAQDVVILLQLQ